MQESLFGKKELQILQIVHFRIESLTVYLMLQSSALQMIICKLSSVKLKISLVSRATGKIKPKIEMSSAFLNSKISTDISHRTLDLLESYQDEMLCLTDFLKDIKKHMLTRDDSLTIKGMHL